MAPSEAVPLLPTLIHRPASFFERLDLTRLFPNPQPLEVELGSGDGTFLTQYAAAHPQHNFIGVERLLGRLRKVDRKGLRAGLANLRLMRIEAWYFVEYLLPAHSVSAIHIYFPDPWPKRRHHRRRLINTRFAEAAWQALVPSGVVFLRTDNPDYFDQMRTVFGAQASFEAAETPVELSSMVTDFERDFHAQGIATLAAAYRRRS